MMVTPALSSVTLREPQVHKFFVEQLDRGQDGLVKRGPPC